MALSSGELASEKAVLCLERMRRAVLDDRLSQRELLNRLDTLEILVLEAHERHCDLLQSSDSRFSTPVRGSPKRDRRGTPNYSLPRDSRAVRTSSRTPSGSSIDGDSPQAIQGAPRDDDSFTRLSILLEHSINLGQDALASTQTPSEGPLLDPLELLNASPSATGNTIDHETGTPGHDLLTTHESSHNSRPNLRRHSSTMGPEDLEEDPPAYKERNGVTTSAVATESLVDDGVTALESLIDQLATSTLASRHETGLTSNRFLMVGSLVVLILSFLISKHSNSLGVNCHCICPATATTYP